MTRMESPLRLRRNSAADDDRPRGVWKYLILLVMISSIIIVPYGWLILRAFTNQQGEFTLSNWIFLTEETTLARGVVLPAATQPMATSFLFAIVMAVLVVSITVPAAYAMSRTEYTGRRFMAKMLIVLDAFPSVALLSSFILLLSNLNLVNKLSGVILLKVAMYLPGSIWLMKGFFDNISWDIEWAAIVDGASRFKTFLRIIVPAAKPGIAVILVNSFLSGWGEYILINLFIRGRSSTMSSLIGAMLDSEDGKYLVSPGVLAAACFCYIIPVIILFAVSQKLLLQVKQGGSKQ
ncbi:MAG: carbohydrate ABC transporter permease [Clostridiales bacterium]|jgi:inositol-phosphate transport system permease protein|nr:carbohydrate ABC transporter permease [Clostridiales bacterium]